MEVPPVTAQMLVTLGVGVVAMMLFVWNRFPFELVGLVVLAVLVVSGVLPIEQALSGFSNEATLTVAGLLILATGLERTGVVDMIANGFARLAGGSELRLLVAIVTLSIPASAFLNNTSVVAVLIPVVIAAARRHGIAPSRLLIPLSFSSQLGGTFTLIGSSTNLLVSGVLVEMGRPRLGFFQMTLPAGLMMLGGVVYLLTLGRRLLPVRDEPEDEFQIPFRAFESALVVEARSSFVGSTFRELQKAGFDELKFKTIRRASQERELGEDEPLRAGDLLVVEGSSSALHRADQLAGLHFARRRADQLETDRDELLVAEAMVPPRSRLVGCEVQEIGQRFGASASVLAVHRQGRNLTLPLAERVLQPGDLILVGGTRDAVRAMHRSNRLTLLTRVMLEQKGGRWWVATGLLGAVVVLAALGVVSMPLSVLLGVIGMVLTGCIELTDTYERIDWSVIILIGSILPLGLAMQQTGAAALLAAVVVGLTSDLGPYLVLGALYLLSSLLTEVVSNNAAAVVLTPVAVAIADALGVSPLPFAMAVMIAASNSFMTPVGYQTNTFIYGPGGYRFSDFIRVGALLNRKRPANDVFRRARASLILPRHRRTHGPRTGRMAAAR